MQEPWFSKYRAGWVQMSGSDALELLNRLSTNQLKGLASTEVAETLLTTNQGKLIDWLRVFRDEGLWLLTSPGRAQKVVDWLEKYTIMEDSSAAQRHEDVPAVRCGGARAAEWAQSVGLDNNRFVLRDGAALFWGPDAFGACVDVVALEPNARLDGFVSEFSSGCIEVDFERIRVAAGVPGPATEYKTETNPLELRLASRAVSFSKGCFIGQEVLARMDSYDKIARVLMGFEHTVPVEMSDDLRVVVDGRKVGKITSMVPGSPSIGLALIEREHAVEGPAKIQGSEVDATIQLRDRPFWMGE